VSELRGTAWGVTTRLARSRGESVTTSRTIAALACVTILACGSRACSCSSHSSASAPKGIGDEPATRAADVGVGWRMYRDDVLARAEAAYAENLKGNFADLVSRLPRKVRAEASDVGIELPARGGGPFAYWSFAAARKVVIPIESVKVFDDLVTAYVWREAHACDPSAMFDYVGMMSSARRAPTLPPPFEALAIPSNVLEAKDAVYRTSGDLLKSAVYYIMAHELGHVVLRHPGNRQVTFEESQRNEIAADAFALDAMTQIGTVPVGMVFFFRAVAYYETPPDDASAAEFRERMAHSQTHPLSADRLRAITDGIRQRWGAFTAASTGNKPAAVATFVTEVEKLTAYLDDVRMRNFQRARSEVRSLASLRSCEEWRPVIK
jgi:hypothetical protein